MHLSLSFFHFVLGLPLLILIGCGGLLVTTVAICVILRRETFNLIQDLHSFCAVLERDGPGITPSPSRGVSVEAWDRICANADALDRRTRGWWQSIVDVAERYSPTFADEAYFMMEPATEVLPYDFVVIPNLRMSLYRALPGLLTGLGLMLTFVAILMALYGVHYDKANTIEPVSGMEGLINGLSGKFMSSIVALLSSIAFTLYEQRRMRLVKIAYRRFIDNIGRTIPRLSSSRVLLDIRKASSDASVEVANISAEVVERFTHAFNEHVVPNLSQGMAAGIAGAFHQQLSPTLDKMTGSLDGLQGAIVGLESQKRESLTGEFERILVGLERSMTEALRGMAERFHEALSGSARQEFGNVQNTLEGTRQMLGSMNDQFSAMQVAFTSVVARAEETTLKQVNSGREQVEAVTAVMRVLMTDLKTNADQNLSTMHTQLTQVVDGLVSKVADVSTEMMRVAHAAAEDSRHSTAALLEQTEMSSQAMTERIEQILQNIKDRSSDFEHASAALRDAQVFISELLQQNGNALASLGTASREVRDFTGHLKNQAEAVERVNGNQIALISKLQTASESLQGGIDQQKQHLERYDDKIAQFEEVMTGLDKSISGIMKATSDGLSDYNQRVRANFDSIVEVANKLIPQAAKSLQGQIEQFGENLEDFSERLLEATQKSGSTVNGRA
jgi:uncharacterized phage infection (PIP) family protein YhgE